MLEQIRPSQLADWLAQLAKASQGNTATQQPPLLLDVREAWEVQQASLSAQDPRFELRHIPMMQIPALLPELDAQRPTLCLCHHGARSMQVAFYLEQQGFTQVANINGGIAAWASECDPSIPQY